MTPQEALSQIESMIEACKFAAKDGLTVSEFSQLTMNVIRTGVALVDGFPTEGSEKKTWVLDAVAVLFDSIADKAIPIYLYPFWILLKPAIRSLVLAAAGGLIESILPVVRAAK